MDIQFMKMIDNCQHVQWEESREPEIVMNAIKNHHLIECNYCNEWISAFLMGIGLSINDPNNPIRIGDSATSGTFGSLLKTK